MLLSDGVYKRIPLFWILAGLLFLCLGLAVGSEFKLFPAYIGFGLLGIVRGIWIYQSRWKLSDRNRVSIARGPRVVRRNDSDAQDKAP